MWEFVNPFKDLYIFKWFINWSYNGMRREMVVRACNKQDAIDLAKGLIPSKAKINQIKRY